MQLHIYSSVTMLANDTRIVTRLLLKAKVNLILYVFYLYFSLKSRKNRRDIIET
jgi:hypothetical protein